MTVDLVDGCERGTDARIECRECPAVSRGEGDEMEVGDLAVPDQSDQIDDRIGQRTVVGEERMSRLLAQAAKCIDDAGCRESLSGHLWVEHEADECRFSEWCCGPTRHGGEPAMSDYMVDVPGVGEGNDHVDVEKKSLLAHVSRLDDRRPSRR